MRVYEISKQLNIPSKQLIEVLQKENFQVKSHMSVLDEKAVAFLQKKFSKSKAPVPSQSSKVEQNTMHKAPANNKTNPKKKSSFSQRKSRKPIARAVHQRKNEEAAVSPTAPTEVVVDSMAVDSAARLMGKPVTDVILTLLRWGTVAAKNQTLTQEMVKRLAHHYEIKVLEPTIHKKNVERVARTGEGDLQERRPIVVVVGHVDHGKTTLLDFIRKTRVASREKGGITQHIGAYEATTKHGNIVFLDTPGHEAFSKIRQRGVHVADLVILMVAADDGIMPQTVEAIKFAKSMSVPIIVAINKIDKADPQRIEVVKRQLSQHDLLAEEWGGDVVCAPISAKEGLGVDYLLEMISLQAQMLELRANKTGAAKGYVLESKLEKGRGPVATLICQHGKVVIGDYFTCGVVAGRVSSMVDSYGKRVDHVGPSVPVQIAGFSELPEAGDFFEVVDKDTYLKARKSHDERKSSVGKGASREDSLNLIVKVDTNSSREALLDSITRLSKKTPVGLHVLQSGVGAISEGDVELAFNTGSRIIALHVKPESNAAALAQRRGVVVETYDIIYKLLEALEERAEKSRKVVTELKKIGEANVLKVFHIKGIGVIAGSYVRDGTFSRDGRVVVYRGNEKIGEGKIVSLQREKRAVKEAHAGFECGFMVDGFNDWEIDDRVECFVVAPVKK